jgi:hypothetical protein
MESGRNRIFAPIAFFALMAGFQCGTANAGKSGAYFSDSPDCCIAQPAFNVCPGLVQGGLAVCTANVSVANGILRLNAPAKGPAYSDNSHWVSAAGNGAVWKVENYEALRKDFDYPVNRARVYFFPEGTDCVGYLAAFTRKNQLLVQVVVSNPSEGYLDTRTTKGQIAYVLASYSGAGCSGKLGTIGYWTSMR